MDTDRVLLDRLLRRAHAPLGVVDTRPARRMVERWVEWQARHQGLSARLLARGASDDEEATPQTPAVVWRAFDTEPGTPPAAASEPDSDRAASSTLPNPDPVVTPDALNASDAPAAPAAPVYRLRRVRPDMDAGDAPASATTPSPAPSPAAPSAPRHDASAVPTVGPARMAVAPAAAADEPRRFVADASLSSSMGAQHAGFDDASPRASTHAAVAEARRIDAPSAAARHAPVVTEQPRPGARAGLARGAAALAPLRAPGAGDAWRRAHPADHPEGSIGERARAERVPLNAPFDHSGRPGAAFATASANASLRRAEADAATLAARAQASPPQAPSTTRRDPSPQQLVERVTRLVLDRLSIDIQRRAGRPWR